MSRIKLTTGIGSTNERRQSKQIIELLEAINIRLAIALFVLGVIAGSSLGNLIK